MRRTAAGLALSALLALAPAAGAATTFVAPIDPPTIDAGCDYASRDCSYPSYHTGIDYRGDDPPNEQVHAVADGLVRIAATPDESHGFGNAIVLEHRLTGGGTVYSLYGHLANAPTVSPGDCVPGGASLGLQGDTGDTANVATHFEIKRDPKIGPPWGYSKGPPDDYGYFDPKSFIGKRRANDVCAVRAACADAGGISIDHPREQADLSRRELRIRGRADGGAAVAGCPVELAIRRTLDVGCAWWRPHGAAVHRSCRSPRWFKPARVRDDGSWRYRLPRALKAGRYAALARLQGQPRAVAHFTLR